MITQEWLPRSSSKVIAIHFREDSGRQFTAVDGTTCAGRFVVALLESTAANSLVNGVFLGHKCRLFFYRFLVFLATHSVVLFGICGFQFVRILG